MQESQNGEAAAVNFNQAGIPGCATVAVIITAFNQARFLGDAISSVMAQTRPADEVIVVDDGSTDDPATVVVQFEKVRLIQQETRGVSAARNAGVRSCKTSHVVFLDSDDRLLPAAIETGLACIAARPDCAFVYGGYRHISEDGRPIVPDCYTLIDGDAYPALLRANVIAMHASVLYRRDCLLAVNGFDETLPRAEDYDIYLRIAQIYPIASHPEIIAEYRKHGHGMTNNSVEQLRMSLQLLDRHDARITVDALARGALRDGRANLREFYVAAMITEASKRWKTRHKVGILARDVVQAAQWSPRITIRLLAGVLGRRALKLLPRTNLRG